MRKKEIQKEELPYYRGCEIEVWIDPETKVEYLLYNDLYRAAMTPRLNADGSLRINKEN